MWKVLVYEVFFLLALGTCEKNSVFLFCCPSQQNEERTGFSRQFLTRQETYLQRNIETRSCIHCCCGKVKIITYYESVFVALASMESDAQYYIVIFSCLALPYFSTLFHRRHDFLKKTSNIKFCFHFLKILSEAYLILRKSERDTNGCWLVLSPTRKETSYNNQTRDLFNILPTKLNTLLSPLL